MNSRIPRSLLKIALLVLLAAVVCSPRGHAQTLSSGNYRVTADLGAVLLDGRYPFTLSELPALLDVTTLPNGVVTGKAVLFGQPVRVKGAILATSKRVRLTLRAKFLGRNFFLVATQQGGAFVGVANVGRVRVPVRIPLAGSGTVRPHYQVALTVRRNGVISGAGTLALARRVTPVTVTGRVVRGQASVLLRGGRTFLRVAGPVDAGGFCGKWSAQSHGSLMKGANLRVAADPS